MKTRYIVSVAISMASMGAMGNVPGQYDANSQSAPVYVSQLSREEVKADVREAVKTGTLPVANEAGTKAITPNKVKSTRNRADVKTEVRDANKAHALPAAGETGVVAVTPTKIDSTRSRTEVKTEVREAVKARKLPVVGEIGQ
ncbi:MAG: hypothetical protein Q7K57_40015 [Burkholderiaceae bacterium]|nr:hypothetical protein [Burkholderiaceae bacterium]